MQRNVFSTYQAAEICNTSFMSVNRWINTGKLKSYRTPGGHHRIVKDDLIDFMKENSIPILDEIIQKRYKVIIVDDDPNACDLLAQGLRFSQYNIDVTTAHNGFEAGALISQIVSDVVLLDLMMPGIDGFKVCNYIKTNPQIKNCKVVIITGHGNDDNVEKAMAVGADRALLKPVNIEKILEEIVV